MKYGHVDLGASKHHCPRQQSVAYDAELTLRNYTVDSGIIPDELQSLAFKAASLATGRRWSSARCRNLAKQRRLIN